MESEKFAKRYFDSSLTDRERAIFEGGIALGAIAHQFAGIPVSRDRKLIRLLELAMAKTMRLAPYKKYVKVRIRPELLRKETARPYLYQPLEEKHLDVTVTARYANYEAVVRMEYVPKIKFPLMYVEKVRSIKAR